MFKREDITVEMIRYCGDDLAVVNAARVSFDKESDWEREYMEYEFYDEWGSEHSNYTCVGEKLRDADGKLIKYLAKHNHFTPFTHCFATFRITCPIAVARQLHKHQVGLSVNEVSRRYVSSDPTFYVPPILRGKASNKKQGSEGHVPHWSYGYMEDETGVEGDWGPIEWAYQHCFDVYRDMLEKGVCEEQARLVLPVGANTTFIWSGSLAAFARVINLRTSEDAQFETRIVASEIARNIAHAFPHSYEALCNYEQDA